MLILSLLRLLGLFHRRSPSLRDQLLDMANLRQAWEVVRTRHQGPEPYARYIARFGRRLDTNLHALRRAVSKGNCRPRPYRFIFVPKSDGGLRPLAVPAVEDLVLQRALYNVIGPIWEPYFLDCSFGFRPGRGVEDAVMRVAAYRDEGYRWVVDADIKRCFESFDHKILFALLRRHIRDAFILKLIWACVAAGGNGRTGMGVPQGAPISPLLCNIYLHEFDQRIVARFPRLVRYADDFVILCRDMEEAQRALEEARLALEALRLSLHPQKTRITHFRLGFKFLGVFFLGDRIYPL
jgi:group II intron reverse transcriptase/maturase